MLRTVGTAQAHRTSSANAKPDDIVTSLALDQLSGWHLNGRGCGRVIRIERDNAIITYPFHLGGRETLLSAPLNRITIIRSALCQTK